MADLYRVEITTNEVYSDGEVNKGVAHTSHFTFEGWYDATTFIEQARNMIGFIKAEKIKIGGN